MTVRLTVCLLLLPFVPSVLLDADAIRAQVDAADAAGTNGGMPWNPRNRHEPDALSR